MKAPGGGYEELIGRRCELRKGREAEARIGPQSSPASCLLSGVADVWAVDGGSGEQNSVVGSPVRQVAVAALRTAVFPFGARSSAFLPPGMLSNFNEMRTDNGAQESALWSELQDEPRPELVP